MIKSILAATALTLALSAGASAATMKPMHNMAMKQMHHMAMKKHCGKHMMMMHGKCMADHSMKMMKK
jgi:hypothetical protein